MRSYLLSIAIFIMFGCSSTGQLDTKEIGLSPEPNMFTGTISQPAKLVWNNIKYDISVSREEHVVKITGPINWTFEIDDVGIIISKRFAGRFFPDKIIGRFDGNDFEVTELKEIDGLLATRF